MKKAKKAKAKVKVAGLITSQTALKELRRSKSRPKKHKRVLRKHKRDVSGPFMASQCRCPDVDCTGWRAAVSAGGGHVTRDGAMVLLGGGPRAKAFIRARQECPAKGV